MISAAIRFIVYALLILGSYEEAGICTAVAFFILFVSGEITLLIAGPELKRIGKERAEEWKRKREAKRKDYE